MLLDIDELKKYLLDYFGSAFHNGNYLAINELTKVENATTEELIEIALNNNVLIEDYIIFSNQKKLSKLR